MLSTPTNTRSSPSLAELHARRNWQANLRALQSTQPGLASALQNATPDLTWTYARDNYLSALDPAGHWLSTCSLPHRAAQEMLRKLAVTGTACFLSPAHAAQLDVALSILQPQQAILAVLPHLPTLAAALHCGDFADAIHRHRLWLAAGPDWPAQLQSILESHPGLPAPQQFIKPITLPESDASLLIPAAQKVFSHIAQHRLHLRAQLRSAPRLQKTHRIGLLVPSRFRLWDDAGAILLQTLADPSLHHLDPDDPCSAGQLAVALAAQDCNALITANCTRSDLPDLLPDDTPIITWLTTPRIPFCTNPLDGLLLADPHWLQLALSANWPPHRLAVVAWPPTPGSERSDDPDLHLALIADTVDVSAPPTRFEFSTHQLLWDLIRDQLLNDPFQLTNIQDYLTTRMAKLGIQPQGFDHRLFVDRLILPAYQQGLTRLVANADLPLRLYGQGWSAHPHFAGTIASRDDLHRAAASAAALIHPFPISHAHPIDALSRPVLQPLGKNRNAFLNEARHLLAAPPSSRSLSRALSRDRSVASSLSPLTRNLVLSLLPS